jgi:uridylate kinase
MKEKIVISLGGSILVPEEVDHAYLKAFRDLIDGLSDRYQFIIVCGGGKTARKYINSADLLGLSDEEKDQLGISCTRLNAQLTGFYLKDLCRKEIILDPTRPVDFTEAVMLAGGFMPGNTTDKVAVILAQTYDIKKVLNLTNINYVYNMDPGSNPDATPLEKMSWKEYLDIIGTEHKPGKNTPFDPVASRLAMENSISVCILNGSDLENVRECILGNRFKGTDIMPGGR